MYSCKKNFFKFYSKLLVLHILQTIITRYTLSMRIFLVITFFNNVVITTVIEMVEMVEILDGRLGKRSIKRVKYVI